MEKDKNLGEQVAAFRNLREMKQEVMAEALGVTQQAVSKIERQKYISDKKLEEIAEVLGVEPEVIKSYDKDKIFAKFSLSQGGIEEFLVGLPKESDQRLEIFKLVAVYREFLQEQIKKLDLAIKSNK